MLATRSSTSSILLGSLDLPRAAVLQPIVVSLEEKIDTSSAAGELVFHVFGSIAQFERRLIAERTRDGIAAARAEGRKPGRPALDREKVRAALTLVRSYRRPRPQTKSASGDQPSTASSPCSRAPRYLLNVQSCRDSHATPTWDTTLARLQR